MKHFTLFLFALWSQQLIAQDSQWFNLGDTWTYAYGIVSGPQMFQETLAITELTTLNGIDCAKMESSSSPFSNFFSCMPFAAPFYFYESNDSVYYATEADQTFRLLYDFNAQVGESWYLVAETFNGLDSMFITVADVVEVVLGGTTIRQLTLDIIPANTDNPILEIISPVRVVEYAGALDFFLIAIGKYNFCDSTTGERLQCFSGAALEYTSPEFSSCTLGLFDKPERHALKIYPNPAADFFQIDLPILTGTIDQLEIYDLRGRRIQSRRFVSAASRISLTAIPAGLYQIRATTANGIFIGKLMVR